MTTKQNNDGIVGFLFLLVLCFVLGLLIGLFLFPVFGIISFLVLFLAWFLAWFLGLLPTEDGRYVALFFVIGLTIGLFFGLQHANILTPPPLNFTQITNCINHNAGTQYTSAFVRNYTMNGTQTGNDSILNTAWQMCK